MKIVSKFIFWISILLIFGFVVLPVIIGFTSVQFTNDHYESGFKEVRMFCLPVIILLTLFGTIKDRYSQNRIITTIGLTLLAAIISFFILLFSAFADMCAWKDNRTLFIKAGDPTTKIILRSYGCGATDSGYPVYKVFKIKNLTSSFVSVTDIDTTKIDKTHWIYVNREE